MVLASSDRRHATLGAMLSRPNFKAPRRAGSRRESMKPSAGGMLSRRYPIGPGPPFAGRESMAPDFERLAV